MADSADEYYDKLIERDRKRVWWRVALNYCAAVISFFIILYMAIGAYWVWEDYGQAGFRNLTWENWTSHARFRWEELLKGRIGLDCNC